MVLSIVLFNRWINVEITGGKLFKLLYNILNRLLAFSTLFCLNMFDILVL